MKHTLKLTQQKIENDTEAAYLAILALYLIKLSTDTTLLGLTWPNNMEWILRVLMATVVFLRLGMCVSFRSKKWYLAIFVLIAFGAAWLKSGIGNELDIALVMVGAFEIDYRKILKVCFFIGVGVLAIAMIASLTGRIEDVIYSRGLHIRHSFGIVYPTDFAARVFYMALIWWVLYGERLWILTFFADLGLAWFVYRYSGARTSALLLVAAAVAVLYLHYTKKYYHKLFSCLEWIMAVVPFAVAGFMIWLAVAYNPETEWMQKLNQFLTWRLMLAFQAYQKRGISLFGQFFVLTGFGWKTEAYGPVYDFVDCSYVLILLQYGCILLGVFASLYLLFEIQVKKENRALLFCFVLIAIHSVMEHHFIDIAYNWTLVILLSAMKAKDSELRRKL